MIRCVAIDDEPLALKQIAAYVAKIPFLELVAVCPSAKAAGKVLASERVDALFVDINMPDVSGMDFVRELASPPLVVFTTAYSEYALESYKVDAVDYLLKPFGLDEFRRAADKVRARFELQNAAVLSQGPSEEELFFKTEYRVVRVELSSILYVEGMSEYLKIHLDGGREPVVVLLSMKKLEERLPSERFMRIHKSYIVNLGKIREVSRGRIAVDGAQTSLPIGDLYKDAFNSWLDSKFLGK